MTIRCNTSKSVAPGETLFELWVPRNGTTWITSNHRFHHMKLYRLHQAWAKNTMVAAAVCKVPKNLPPAVLHSEFRFQFGRRRDPLNFADSIKPAIDFLVKSWHCWPDDNPEFLTQEAPTIGPNQHEDGILLKAVARGA